MIDGAARLAARYPVVWHVIEADGAGSWLSETGLLPAAYLQQMAGLADDGSNRNAFRRIDFGAGRSAVLRFQQMPDLQLTPTLAGSFAGRPDLWRRHINQHVFFWAQERRCTAFIRACMRLRDPSNAHPVTLAIDTATLLVRHSSFAFYATVNTGSTVRGGARIRRDDATFHPVAEIAIRGCVDLECSLYREEKEEARNT